MTAPAKKTAARHGVAPPQFSGPLSSRRPSAMVVGAVTDTLTPAERSERMSRIRGRDTKPEMTIRRLVHGMGYRYRLHRRDLPGIPDLVFPARKKVIFIHGCFWHRHPDPACKLARLPKSRLDFWKPKLEANRRRDLAKQSQLRGLGWEILVVWECEIGDKEQLENKLRVYLGEHA